MLSKVQERQNKKSNRFRGSSPLSQFPQSPWKCKPQLRNNSQFSLFLTDPSSSPLPEATPSLLSCFEKTFFFFFRLMRRLGPPTPSKVPPPWKCIPAILLHNYSGSPFPEATPSVFSRVLRKYSFLQFPAQAWVASPLHGNAFLLCCYATTLPLLHHPQIRSNLFPISIYLPHKKPTTSCLKVFSL